MRSRARHALPASRRKAPLTLARVVAAALARADAAGLEALSMRSVAEQLGVEAMSLYRHIDSKDALLDALIDRVIAEMELPSPAEAAALGWQRSLAQRADSMRAALLRHPWAAGLIESRTTPSETRLTFNERSMRLLVDEGLGPEHTYGVLLAVDSYVYGFVAQEVWFPVEREDRPALLASMKPRLDPARFPSLVHTLEFLMTRAADGVGASSKAGQDADFAFGLRAMLAGLASQVASAEATSTTDPESKTKSRTERAAPRRRRRDPG